MTDNNENETPVVESTDFEDIEKILAGYDKPATDSAPVTSSEPVPGKMPWETDYKEPSGKQVPFSISHNPSGSDPEIRYYKTGPKAGQPRPARKGQAISKPTEIKASSFLTGAILISMVDMLIPMALAGLNNWRSKVKINADDMKMTDAQKKELDPVATAVLQELNIQASPTLLMGVMMVGIYAGNLMLLRSDAEAKQKLNEKTKEANIKADSVNNVRRVPNSSY